MTSAQRKEAISAFLFIAPFLVWMVFFMGGPILAAVFLSFTDSDGGMSATHIVGFENYAKMFSDQRFWASLYNTVFFTFFSVPIGMILSVIVALLMNQKVKGIAIYRTVFYVPSVLGAGVAVAILWRWVFQPDYGLLNNVISMISFGHLEGPKWLASEAWSKPALILMSFWGVGSSMIIYLAGLQGIPTALYEAAEIDGANRWQQFWTVTLPGLSPVIFFQLIIAIVFSFQIFNQVFVMTDSSGGPADSTLVMVLYIYLHAFKYNMHMGYASAMACFLFLIIMAATWMQFKFSKWVYYEGELRN